MQIKVKKIIKLISRLAIIFVIASIAAVLMEHYFFPRLSSSQSFKNISFLKKASEKVTIINRTEQVIIKEEDSLSAIASSSLPALVNIVSVAKDNHQERIFPETKNTTGIIATSDGIIATYRDGILENNAIYKVMLFDGSFQEASLFSIDEFTNLAYFKINVSNLTSIPLADSDEQKPGKKIIAISNAGEEYQNKFSSGIISYRNKTFNIAGKTVSSSEKLEGVLEIDIFDIAGFSGAPVINYQGEMIGMIGSVFIDGQKKIFLVPSNIFKKSLELAIKNEIDSRPALGVYYRSLTKSLTISAGLTIDRGAIIYSPSGKRNLAILAGSAAEKAGLEIGDIIVAVNEQEINLDNPLSVLISRHKKGDVIDLSLIRNKKEIKLKVRLQ